MELKNLTYNIAKIRQIVRKLIECLAKKSSEYGLKYELSVIYRNKFVSFTR